MTEPPAVPGGYRMHRIALLLSLLFACAAPALAQTAEEQARLDWVLQRGRLLFDIDRAAWVTTDDLRERLPDFETSGIRGWTVERDGAAYSVIFYAGEGDARVAAYRARVENNRVVAAELIPLGSRPILTPFQRRLADARGVVGRAELRSCSSSGLNIAVIPPDTIDGPMDIYVLTPQTQAGVFPFGGHNRITASASGDVLSQRAFTVSCANMQPALDALSVGITHSLDELPTEIHVFVAIWMRLPVDVAIGEPMRLWEVTGEHVRLITDPQRRPRL